MMGYVSDCLCIPRKARPWCVILGGVLVHLTLGTVYTFGNMTPYITSYIRANETSSTPKTISYSQSVWTFALMLVGQGGSMFLGGLIEKKLGPRWTTLLGGWIMSIGVLLTYITIKVSFYLMLATYGLLFGIGVGIAYAPPMACAMKWMPQHKGLVNGMVVAGFGAGAFIFDQIQTKYVNPDGKVPTFVHGTDKYFVDKDLLDRIPSCFILLALLYAAMQFVGSMLLIDPEGTKQSEEAEHILSDSDDSGIQHPIYDSLNVTPKEMLRSKSFLILWLTFLVNGQAVVFTSSLYKTYGQTFIHGDGSDYFLALVGAFAALFNASGRIFWGHLADRYSYKVAMLCLTTAMVALMSTLILPSYLAVNSSGAKAMFFLWICLIFGAFSGSFALLPTATARCFGQKYVAINYGLVFTSQVITGPLGAFLATQLQSHIGWFGMFTLVAGFSFTGFLLTCCFRAKRLDDSRDV